MDCHVKLTHHDINNIISALYAQHTLEDEVALDLLDRLSHECDRCLAEHQGTPYQPSQQYLDFRHRLNRQLYAHMRDRKPPQPPSP